MSGYVGAIIEFARIHENLAYGLVFVLALSEALPFVGAFVPGTAVILGVSALVPSGAVSVWPLIAYTTMGAVVGDGISYWLGHHYHQAVISRWPLDRHPELIARGEAMFRGHGGKSVFIARFTPGVRAVVPLIAGILRMSPIRFYAMNLLSAAVWAPSHVLGGALIGASLVLLGAVAGRLAVFLVVLVAVLWIVAWTMRYAMRRLPPLALRASDQLLAWAHARDSWLGRQALSFLDPARKELPALLLFGAALVAGLWVFFGVLEDVISGDPLLRADAAVFHLLQSLRTVWADQVMVAVTELGGGIVTTAVAAAGALWFARRRAWRALSYWVAAVGFASLFTLVLKITLRLPRPAEVYSGWDAFSFPSGHTTVNAALYGLLAMLVARESSSRWRLSVVIAAALFVSAIAFSRLYLGAHWISDVVAGLAFGVAWAALLSIAYLRRTPPPIGAGRLGAVLGLTLLVVGSIVIRQEHAADITRYAVRENVRSMDAQAWWTQGWAELPARRVDLVGELEEPFTVQWAGKLQDLKQELAAKGWRVPVPWTIRSSLAWLAPHADLQDLPVLPRLDDGRLEALVMIQPVEGGASTARLVLHLWNAPVQLATGDGTIEPLFIGIVAEERMRSVTSFVTVTRERPDMNSARDALASAIDAKRLVERKGVVQDSRWDGSVLLGHDPMLWLPGQ